MKDLKEKMKYENRKSEREVRESCLLGLEISICCQDLGKCANLRQISQGVFKVQYTETTVAIELTYKNVKK